MVWYGMAGEAWVSIAPNTTVYTALHYTVAQGRNVLHLHLIYLPLHLILILSSQIFIL